MMFSGDSCQLPIQDTLRQKCLCCIRVNLQRASRNRYQVRLKYLASNRNYTNQP